jgi:hypothetical protein
MTDYNSIDAQPINVQDIIDYEDGSLSIEGTLHLFSSLIRRGHLPHLQGHYGRAAASPQDGGYLDDAGSITNKGFDFIDQVANTEPF